MRLVGVIVNVLVADYICCVKSLGYLKFHLVVRHT